MSFSKTSVQSFILGEPENVFYEIKNSINENINEILNLRDYIITLINMAEEIATEKGVDFDNYLNLFGHFSLRASRGYLVTFADYLKDTLETLGIIEEIYPLLKNDTGFQKGLEMLRTDLSTKINEIRNIRANSQEICNDYEIRLKIYQKIPWRPIDLLITNKAHKLYREVFSGFRFVPQTYFNALKFLRINWYNYEASIIEI